MKRNIKHYFLPHRKNNHTPYLLSLPVLAALLILVLLMQTTYNVFASGDFRVLGFSSTIDETELITQTNFERSSHGVGELTIDLELQKSAQLKAQDMLDRDYWSHQTPEGEDPWVFFEEAGYEFSFAGENLARGFITTAGTVAGWMNSEGHRENLLNPTYTEVGFGVVTGEFQGETTTVVVAHYARPKDAPQLVSVASSNQISALPAQQTFGVLNPLSPRMTMGWAAQMAAIIAAALGVLHIVQHLVIRQKSIRWERALHQHPMLRAAVFFIATTLMISSSFGIVG